MIKTIATIALITALSGCASTYGNLVSGSNLGAQEYRPAVLVMPGHQADYDTILGICRIAATNRQITAAQEAQLTTITGAVSGGAAGLTFGMQFGSMMKDAGLGTSVNRTAGMGLAAGLIGSLADSFASGTKKDASETKNALLNCLRLADERQTFYKIIE